MEKYNAVYLHSGALFSLKEGGNLDTCHTVNEPRGDYTPGNEPDTKDGHYRPLLPGPWSSHIQMPQKVVAGSVGKRTGELVLNGDNVSF